MLKERLISLRKNNKYTQDELAKKLNISRPTYAQYELGRRRPDYDVLLKIADFYEVSLDYLIKGKETKSEESNLFFFDMEGLSEEEIEDIKRHIDYVKWKAQHGGNKK